jgi:hypothetical protein
LRPVSGGTLGVHWVALARMVTAWLRVGRTAPLGEVDVAVGG